MCTKLQSNVQKKSDFQKKMKRVFVHRVDNSKKTPQFILIQTSVIPNETF